MSVRAKMKVSCITTKEYTGGYSSVVVRLECQYDTSIPEDQRFARATPTGHMELQVDNPAALEQLIAGKDYYVDIVLAD